MRSRMTVQEPSLTRGVRSRADAAALPAVLNCQTHRNQGMKRQGLPDSPLTWTGLYWTENGPQEEAVDGRRSCTWMRAPERNSHCSRVARGW